MLIQKFLFNNQEKKSYTGQDNAGVALFYPLNNCINVSVYIQLLR